MNGIKKLFVFLTFSCFALGVLAVDASKAISGTVQIEIALLGADPNIKGLSKGILSFQGKQYPFTLSGINLVKNAIGAGKLTATGKVYDLSEPSQFQGTYMKLDGNLGLVKNGSGTYKSSNGVSMFLEGLSNAEILIDPKGSVIKFSN